MLGVGICNNHGYIPIIIPTLKDIVHITCGGQTCYAQDSDSRVFVWGSNNYGELALLVQSRDDYWIFSPIVNEALCNKTIIPGWSHIVVIDLENNVSLFGQKPRINMSAEAYHAPKRAKSANK
jgi:hypothetical protein